jgi:hypothetical protein
MKTFPLFATVAILAAFVAFLFFPFRFEITFSALFAGGLAMIAFSDYRRAARQLPAPAPVAVTPSRKERFGLAA